MTDCVDTEADRVSLESKNIVDERLRSLQNLIPEVFDENGINFEALRESLGDRVSSAQERFGISWPGKTEARRKIQETSLRTLMPMDEESVGWAETKNVIIEGDNLEVLKLLQSSYHGKIKLIYMDPPYNTGKDFVYDDSYKQDYGTYLLDTGQKEKDGARSVANTEVNGRYHSNWLSMMYPRLLLSRSLLRDDGAIFISIGKEEVANLVLIVKEIFGEENFLGIVTRVSKKTSDQGKFFAPSVDYVIVAARDKDKIEENKSDFKINLKEDDLNYKKYEKKFKHTDENGRKYQRVALYQTTLSSGTNHRYWIKCPDGTYCIPPGNALPAKIGPGEKAVPEPKRKGQFWRWTAETYLRDHAQLDIVKKSSSPLITPEKAESEWNVFTKQYLDESLKRGQLSRDYLDESNFLNATGTKELKDLNIPREEFSYPKPTALIQWCIELACQEGIVLDIFAGSATTGDAVVKSNFRDNGDRRYILIQLPEPVDSDRFSNIADITRERMRQVATRERGGGDNDSLIASDFLHKVDLGFRSYKLTDSNFVPWNGFDIETQKEPQSTLLDSNVREGAVPGLIAYEIILKLGYPLTSKVEEKEYANCPFYEVEDGKLLLYTSNDLLSIDAIEEAVNHTPRQIVLLESCFGGNDELKVNILQTIRSARHNGSDIEVKIL